MTLVAKIAGTPLAAAPSVRDALATVDRDQPVFDVTTLDALVGDSLLARRLTMQMMSLFGLVALALAALGLYGVVAYSVTERAHDLGVRVALGASPRDISELVVRGGFRLALAGITIGLVGAGAASRLLTSLLYGVEPLDPATYAAGAGLLVAVSVLATWIPARRAMRVDPIEALREG